MYKRLVRRSAGAFAKSVPLLLFFWVVVGGVVGGWLSADNRAHRSRVHRSRSRACKRRWPAASDGAPRTRRAERHSGRAPHGRRAAQSSERPAGAAEQKQNKQGECVTVNGTNPIAAKSPTLYVLAYDVAAGTTCLA